MPLVGILTVDLVAKTASFEGVMAKAPKTARDSAKGIQDAFNGMDFGEARGGLMLIDDLFGIHLPRHAVAFAAAMPGVMQAAALAMPVAAIAAIGYGLVEATAKAREHSEAMQKDRDAMMDAALAMSRHADSLQLSNLRIQDQISLLGMKMPQNGVKIAMEEGRIATDALTEALRKAINEETALLGKQEQGFFSKQYFGDNAGDIIDKAKEYKVQIDQLMSGLTLAKQQGTKDEVDAAQRGLDAELAGYKKFLDDKRGQDDKDRQREVSNMAADQRRILDDYMARTAATTRANNLTPYGNAAADAAAAAQRAKATEQYNKNIVEQEASINEKWQQRGAILNDLTILLNNYNRAQQNQADVTSSAVQKATIEQVQARINLINKQYESEKTATDGATKYAIAYYENEYAAGALSAMALTVFKDQELDKQYSAERAHLEQIKTLDAARPELVKATEKQIEALDLAHKSKLLENATWELEQEKKLVADQVKEIMAQEEKRNNAELKASDARIAFYNKYQEGAQRIVTLQAEIADQDSIQAQKMAIATGHLTEQQAAEQNLATLEKNKADTMKTVIDRLNQQFDLVYKLREATNGGTTGTDDENKQYQKSVEDYQAMKTQELEIEKKFQSQINAARLQAANNEHSQWNKMFLDYRQIQTHMSQFARQTLGEMNSDLAQFVVTGKGNWQQLATSATESILRMALEYAESKAESAIIDAGWFAAKKAMNATDANSSAARAAAATLGDVPYPLNIPAAASVLAVGEGFAADAMAMRGAVLPNRDLMVHTHPEEMILPQHISNFIVNAANNASSNNSSAKAASVQHFHYSPTTHTFSSADAEKMMDNHMEVFKKRVMQEIRRMNY